MHAATIRFLGAILAGAVAGVLAGILVAPRYALLIGPLALAVVFIAWTLPVLVGHSPERARALSNQDDAGPVISEALVAVAALGSLGAVAAVIMLGASDTRLIDAMLCLVTAFSSWAMVHVMFAGRYTRLYWTAPSGGIDFGGDPPVGWDFLYFSFNLGMTYQVSDTTVTSSLIRRTVLGHCLVSYLFGTMIIACAINLVLGLVAG